MNEDKAKDKSFIRNAAEAFKADALQEGYTPGKVREGCCPDADSGCAAGNASAPGHDCASCSFKCAMALDAANPGKLSPMEERGSIDRDTDSTPVTTFPLPQIIIIVSGFILGCFLSQIFLGFFH